MGLSDNPTAQRACLGSVRRSGFFPPLGGVPQSGTERGRSVHHLLGRRKRRESNPQRGVTGAALASSTLSRPIRSQVPPLADGARTEILVPSWSAGLRSRPAEPMPFTVIRDRTCAFRLPAFLREFSRWVPGDQGLSIRGACVVSAAWSHMELQGPSPCAFSWLPPERCSRLPAEVDGFLARRAPPSQRPGRQATRSRHALMSGRCPYPVAAAITQYSSALKPRMRPASMGTL